tara:strand:+ start:634 stop:828 length:195 start_codon:yes stop_codon:yes gene_type:complete
MKIGDLVRHKNPSVRELLEWPTGVVVDFPVATHPKQFQKVAVMTSDGELEEWILQFCEVINESG